MAEQTPELSSLQELMLRSERDFYKDLEEIVERDTQEYPTIGSYIKTRMAEALTTSERAAIAQTTLAVYKAVLSLPLEISLDVDGGDSSDVTLDLWIKVTEDDMRNMEEGLNPVFVEIKQRLDRYPEVARYITANMNELPIPEQAARVGMAALVVFESLLDFPGRSKGN